MAETRVASNGAFRLGSALLGVLLLVLGAAAFVAPFLAGVAANLAFGSVLVVAGVVRIVYAAKGGGAERVGISALLGLVSIVAGALLLFRPVLGLLSLTLLVGGYLVVHGLLEAFAAVQWKKRGRPWLWMLFGGLVALALGALILFEWPASGLFTIGVFVAVHLCIVGVGLIMAALVGAPAARSALARSTEMPSPA